MAVIMKGMEVVNAMKEKMLFRTSELMKKGITPRLAIVRLGAKPDDLAYERGAVKRCESVGIKCTVFEFPENIPSDEFADEFRKINNDAAIHGILLFRPLPKQINDDHIKNNIDPAKDIDCMSPVSTAKVFAGDDSGFAPCTPEAVLEILDYYKIPIQGKQVVIVGRSMVVGKPLSMMLLKKHATITICHTRTSDIENVCRRAEILIAAAGKAKMVTAGFIPPGGIVIDVGINVDSEGRLCGDVDYESAIGIASYVTPVPGGVGTVTSSVLANHVIRAAELTLSL